MGKIRQRDVKEAKEGEIKVTPNQTAPRTRERGKNGHMHVCVHTYAYMCAGGGRERAKRRT